MMMLLDATASRVFLWQGCVVLSLIRGSVFTDKEPQIPPSLPQDLLDFLQRLVHTF